VIRERASFEHNCIFIEMLRSSNLTSCFEASAVVNDLQAAPRLSDVELDIIVFHGQLLVETSVMPNSRRDGPDQNYVHFLSGGYCFFYQ
jgi:hypothetical protein